MARGPDFRITCCLCGKPVPRSSDVYALDEERKRRFPTSTGSLACGTCAVNKNQWSCRAPDGSHVNGHRAASRKTGCYDSWDHIDSWGTPVAMVLDDPDSGLLQGAADYLRHVANSPRANTETVRRIHEAPDRFDNARR